MVQLAPEPSALARRDRAFLTRPDRRRDMDQMRDIDWSIVWRITTTALREIQEQLTVLLRAEFPLVASQLDQPH